MTIPHWAQPVNPPPPMPPKKNKNTLWITVVACLVCLALCLIGGTVLLLMNNNNDVGSRVVQPSATTTAFTEDDAKRECYTAFRTEFEKRDDSRDQEDVFATVQEIEVLDAEQFEGDYVVNGTVHYSLNTGGVSVSDTLDLTCTASYTSDGTVLTDVENRD